MKKITLASKDADYAQWYLDVAHAGQMYEYAPVAGCITFLPKSVSLWNTIRRVMSDKIVALGVQDIMLPLLIPVSFFEREKDHIEGFAPEFATVTHVGGKELPEHFAIRPTSEVLFCDFFKKQLTSYKDLPLLYNQWANIVRWEKRPRPFLRTSEFHWQEGHTLHETEEEAERFIRKIMSDVYVSIFREYLAIDGLEGEKSASERFPGALHTYTYESMMSNGWALQSCTCHLLSQDFMREFDVTYQDASGAQVSPYYTSWGASTRMIGAIISSHSDERGLILPPKMAEYQAVLLPLFGGEDALVNAYTDRISDELLGPSSEVPVSGQHFRARINQSNVKILVDKRDGRMGEKIGDFELSGYPLAIVYGPRDIASNTVICINRITGEKTTLPIAGLRDVIHQYCTDGQQTLLDRSRSRLRSNTVPCLSESDIASAVEGGKFALYAWDEDAKFEALMKEKYKITTRCMPFAGQFTDEMMPDIEVGKRRTIFARAF